MKPGLAHAAGLLAVLFVPRALGQTVLTEAHLTIGGGTAQITNRLSLWIEIGSPPARLFEDIYVQASDAGHTFTIGPGDDADFAAFAARLTDGQTSVLSYGVNVGNSSASRSPFSELELFTVLPPGNNGVDLGGFVIDHFALRFDTLGIVSPGSDPNRDGVWTDFSPSATFSVYGQPIPEPTSFALLCLGVVLFCARVRWLTSTYGQVHSHSIAQVRHTPRRKGGAGQ